MAALITPTTELSRPARLAQICLSRIHLRPPVDVFAVAKACKVPILEQPPGGPSSDAMLAYHPSADRWGIFINPSFKDPRRRRFSIAHELGHYVLHRRLIQAGHPMTCPQLEEEANEFAGELLMPADSVRLLRSFSMPETAFHVSRAAFEWRCRQLGLAGYI